MLLLSRPTMLSSLVLALLAGCGGGGGDEVTGGASQDGTVVAGSGSSTNSSTTTTVAQPSTTTNGVTTTTGATITTTTSTTTTTIDPSLPPLAANPIVLTKESQVLGSSSWNDAYDANSLGPQVGNAKCEDYSSTWTYYGHAHVSIFRNGERLAIPAHIGWSDKCLYDINSDNQNGVIDAVSTSGYKYLTLGEMFQIWKQPLAWDNIAGITGMPVAVYINDEGNVFRYTGNIANIELANYRSITIQIGTALNEIPTYDWRNYR